MSTKSFRTAAVSVTFCILASGCVLLAAPGAATASDLQAIDFRPVSTAVAINNISVPGLANSGTMVFGKNDSIYIVGDEPLMAVTDGSDPFFLATHPSISDDGNVISFVANPASADPAIFVARKTATPNVFTYTKVADSSFGYEDFDCLLGCDVNNSGLATFGARDSTEPPPPAGLDSIVAGAGGPLDEIIQNPKVFNDPAVNNAGQVAFRTGGSGDEARTLYVDGDPRIIIAQAFPDGPYEAIGRFGLNDAGQVEFIASVHGTNVQGVYRGDGTSTVTIADSTGPYDSFAELSVNNFSQTAFVATLDAGGVKGLYRGPDPVRDKVIAVGDVLFGNVVTDVLIDRDAINDSGDMAFLVQYANNKRQVIFAHPIGKFETLPPDVLDPNAQMSSGGGTGADLFTPVATTGGFASSGNLGLSFDLNFLTVAGELVVSLGDRELGRFAYSDMGPVSIPDIDPLSLFPVGTPLPAELPLRFSLNLGLARGSGATLQVDNIVLANGAGDVFFSDDFSPVDGYFAPYWQFDTSRGGVIALNALSTVPEPNSLALLLLGLVTAAVFSQRRGERRSI